MIGREEQIDIMNEALKSKKSAFIAVTGRRRVGKTYLIDQVFKPHMCLTLAGIQEGDTAAQIKNFLDKVYELSKFKKKKYPEGWQDAFGVFRDYLKTLPKNKKHVIFLDELPWMCTPKTNFVQLLAHEWNEYMSKEPHFILVICGSATSWIEQKIVNDRGGFHNRLTHQLHVQPFTLRETKAFLAQKNIVLSDNAVLQIYMAMGGIPFYLDNIKKGENPTTLLERMCFKTGGRLKVEYDNLFKALFSNATHHEAIVSTLAMTQRGMSREELVKKSKVSDGGSFTRTIHELISSGFVKEERVYGKLKRDSLYRIVDEYVIFYHRFIKKNLEQQKGIWGIISATQNYKIWLGYAFENLCIKHINEIKWELGIGNVYSENYSYRHSGNEYEEGFQIDIIIDRKDKCIHLCECKFYSSDFAITKKQGLDLMKRKQLFKAHLKTNKIVFNTLISNVEVRTYPHGVEAIDEVLMINKVM
jgi:uncharacterized protein